MYFDFLALLMFNSTLGGYCSSKAQHVKKQQKTPPFPIDVYTSPEPPLMSSSSETSTVPCESVMPLNTE